MKQVYLSSGFLHLFGDIRIKRAQAVEAHNIKIGTVYILNIKILTDNEIDFWLYNTGKEVPTLLDLFMLKLNVRK